MEKAEVNCPVLVENLIEVARMAGLGIMKYYTTEQSALSYLEKEVDMARAASLRILVLGLRAHYPNIPIICENNDSGETCSVHRELFSSFVEEDGIASNHCFCICPLDGEKDFIRKISSGFAVSIGFCLHGEPVLGVVCTPGSTPSAVYFSVKGIGAFIESGPAQIPSPLHVASVPDTMPRIVAAESSKYSAFIKSLSADRTYAYVRPPAAVSLRFMLIATGNSHIFPLLHTSSEWETCAAQAIVTAAGGSVRKIEMDALNSPTYMPNQSSKGVNVFDEPDLSVTLRYGKPLPLNDAFIVYGDLRNLRHHSDSKHYCQSDKYSDIYQSIEGQGHGHGHRMEAALDITEIKFNSLKDADEAQAQSMLEFIHSFKKSNGNDDAVAVELEVANHSIENSGSIRTTKDTSTVVEDFSITESWSHENNTNDMDDGLRTNSVDRNTDVEDINIDSHVGAGAGVASDGIGERGHDGDHDGDSDGDSDSTDRNHALLTSESSRWELVGYFLAAVIPLLVSILYAYYYI